MRKWKLGFLRWHESRSLVRVTKGADLCMLLFRSTYLATKLEFCPSLCSPYQAHSAVLGQCIPEQDILIFSATFRNQKCLLCLGDRILFEKPPSAPLAFFGPARMVLGISSGCLLTLVTTSTWFLHCLQMDTDMLTNFLLPLFQLQHVTPTTPKSASQRAS